MWKTATAKRCHLWPETGIKKEGTLPEAFRECVAPQTPTSTTVRELSPLVCGQLLQQPQGN